MVHGLGDDDRHQTVDVGHLLGIARLQGRQCRQKRALTVDETQHIGDIAEWQFFIERLLARFVFLGLWPVSGQCLSVLVVRQMRQFALF